MAKRIVGVDAGPRKGRNTDTLTTETGMQFLMGAYDGAGMLEKRISEIAAWCRDTGNHA